MKPTQVAALALSVLGLAWLGSWLAQPGPTTLALTRDGSGSSPGAGAAPQQVVSAQSAGANTLVSIAQTRAGPLREGVANPSQAQQQRAILQQRYDRAEQSYSAYREATRYPPHSRPITEHPDQVRPFAPVVEDKPLRHPGGPAAKGLRLRTSQERVFLSGQESTRLTVSAVDDEGKLLPITISRALAYTLPDAKNPGQRLQTAMQFTDAGGEVDAQPQDGVHSARLQPAQQGFAQFDGGIRVQLEVQHKDQSGQLSFDVVYAGAVPATWAGVSEALQGGSLVFNLKAQVRQAGRYVVSARVDDANGKPLALLSFNDEVGEGTQQFRLELHGILLRDLQPAFPLRLRDVEAFVLYPDRFPDRALMPRMVGVVHNSANYPLSAFNNQEWTSEERERYLAEYGRDLDRARQELQRLPP